MIISAEPEGDAFRMPGVPENEAWQGLHSEWKWAK